MKQQRSANNSNRGLYIAPCLCGFSAQLL